MFDRPSSTLVLRLAHDGLLATIELLDAPPPPPAEAARHDVPRYACGGCGLLLFAGTPLGHIVPPGTRGCGVRCPACAAVNLLQVNGRRRPPA